MKDSMYNIGGWLMIVGLFGFYVMLLATGDFAGLLSKKGRKK